MRRLYILFIAFFLSFQFIKAQQSPQDFLGYELGTKFTRHKDVVDYFKHVAEHSKLVNYQEYGQTYEGRPLTYALITSEENLVNIEDIRKEHLRNAGILPANPEGSAKKAIVWLSYNVHGNEASSTEAAMLTLYELVTSKQDWLKNTVIILDPCVNPDGRERYVNWYKEVKAEPFDTSPLAIEHNAPWPGGRPNHYLFDLNRDWAWATQKETRQRLKVYNDWLPHIHVDFHEQMRNAPYYFAPAAEPLHEVITPFQKEFQTEIGKNHARYFDEKGWLYFTKERFDLLYPSYGDTYPTFMGAIGMTYEQAGHVGLGIKTSEGYVLSLIDRVAHHHTTGLSTIEIAAQNAERLNREFSKFFQNRDQQYKNYVLAGDADKISALKNLLDRHEISYATAASEKVTGQDHLSGKKKSLISANALVIPTDQPKGKMVKVLMEPSTRLKDSLTYDITAWSLPYAYGLEAIATNDKVITREYSSNAVKNTAVPAGAGYVARWNSMRDAAFLSALLKEGIRVRFSETPLETNGGEFKRGSLVITKSDNRVVEDFDQKLVSIANRFQRQLTPATTGFSISGPDFGSSQVKIINTPRIGLLRGKETSSLNYGEIWYFFEQELEYPVTSIGTEYINDIDLSALDVLILPSGDYARLFNNGNFERLATWIRGGGKIIAFDKAANLFADKEDFSLKVREEKKTDSLQGKNLIPYAERERESIKDIITGSIIKNQLDDTHPLAFGYTDTYLSLKLNSDSYELLDEGFNVAYLNDDPQVVAGFTGSEALKKLDNSLTFGVEFLGKGSVIYLLDNPLFRGFWENGKLFFVNSIFFVNNNQLSTN